MKTRFMALALVVAVLVGFAFAPARSVAAQTTSPFQDIPITGDFLGGTFEGLLDITRFAVQGGELVAIGTLSGTLTNTLGNVIGTVTNVPVTLPVDITQAACEILDLQLGPLDLDLLGLQVHLDEVNLEITAQPGPGNLLGNLLCAIAGLLDNPAGPLAGLARLLNQLLRILG